jgi:hypothetical protein
MASMPEKQIEPVPVEESVAADTDRPANGSDRVALQEGLFQEGLFHVRALNRHGAVRQTPLVTRDGQRGHPFVGSTIDGPFRPILRVKRPGKPALSHHGA